MIRPINLVVVEGALEVPVSVKMLDVLGIPTEGVVLIDKGGRIRFWQDAPRYNQAARSLGPVFGLTDLESAPCPSGLIHSHLRRGRHPDFVLRIAERMLESWLLADSDALARFLRVAPAVFPANPDAEAYPKQTLVNIARRSPVRSIRADLVPAPGSQGVVGKGYTPCMKEFVETKWRPLEAQHKSESLRKALVAIRTVTGA